MVKKTGDLIMFIEEICSRSLVTVGTRPALTYTCK